jgi:phage RecT family recombinase
MTPMAETAVSRKSALLPAPVVSTMRDLMPDVYKLLPPDITSEQFRAACWLELTGNKDVPECVVESIRDVIIYAANYGLMPGRDCHFISYKQKKYRGAKGLQCIPNYFGILRTLDRTGKVRRAFAHPVHEGDEWSFDMFQDRPVHRPAVTLGKTPGKELFYYGAVMFKAGDCAFEVVSLEDLDAIRRRAPGHDSGPWVTDTVMMKRKSAIKRVAKYVQLTPDVRQFLEADDAREHEDIPPVRHQQNVIDLFGEGADPTAHIPASTPPPAGAPESPLMTRIEEALQRQGYSYEAREAWWERTAATYPDLGEPTTLAMLYERLLSEHAQEGHQDALGATKNPQEAPGTVARETRPPEPEKRLDEEIDFFSE